MRRSGPAGAVRGKPRRKRRGIRRHPVSPWNLPNLLTCIRLALAGIFVYLFAMEGMVSTYLALLVFIVAAATDGLDGILARRWKMITPFGIFMDPFADKVLIMSVLLMFVWQNLAPAWLVMVILAREFIVTSLRILADRRGESLPALLSGKQKMASQIVAIIGVLIVECAHYTIAHLTGLPWDTALARMGGAGQTLIVLMHWLPRLLLWLAMILSVVSGIEFISRHRRLFMES